MRDRDCVDFLQWALPRLGMRWPGFRKVRRQVCKRIATRVTELGLPGLTAYRAHLDRNPGEWHVLDAMTCITISRFYRDRGAFAALEGDVLPALAVRARGRGRATLRAWSAGCASGEEPYTLALVWDLAVGPRFPDLELMILATDLDPAVLRRAHEACYRQSSLKELPGKWRTAFEPMDSLQKLRRHHRLNVEIRHHDIRQGAPNGQFDLILCRNLVFTYFEHELQGSVGAQLVQAMRPGGALMIGAHEEIPGAVRGLEPWPDARGVFRRVQPI